MNEEINLNKQTNDKKSKEYREKDVNKLMNRVSILNDRVSILEGRVFLLMLLVIWIPLSVGIIVLLTILLMMI